MQALGIKMNESKRDKKCSVLMIRVDEREKKTERERE